MRVEDLTGQARRRYEYWRYEMGLSEAAALARVAESGAAGPAAGVERPAVPLPEIIARTDALMASGLSESAARREAFRTLYGREPGKGGGVVREISEQRRARSGRGGRAVRLQESDAGRDEREAAELAERLPARSRQVFGQLLAAGGMSRREALEEVARSGMVHEELLEERFRGFGLSPEAARIAAQGRGGSAMSHPDPFQRQVDHYRSRGLSEAAARLAVIGRGSTEEEVRAALWEAERASREVRATAGRGAADQRATLAEVQAHLRPGPGGTY